MLLQDVVLRAQLAFEPIAPDHRYDKIMERVREIMEHPLFRSIKHPGVSIQPEISFGKVLDAHSVPTRFYDLLNAGRIVAYAEGVDKFGLKRLAIVYYSSDNRLVMEDIQEKIPRLQPLCEEGLGDHVVLEYLYQNGFIQLNPAGIYPVNEAL